MMKGNRKKHRRVHKELQRLYNVKRRFDSYETIDGNFTNYPFAYCRHYRAYMTVAQMNTHRCDQRHCKRLVCDIEDKL